jgi:hypothetical protein
MGMCLDYVGKISVEVRRESFKIHANYAYDGDSEKQAKGPLADWWRESVHPEFMLKDLDDLIEALKQAKAFIEREKVNSVVGRDFVEIDLGNGVVKRVRKVPQVPEL